MVDGGRLLCARRGRGRWRWGERGGVMLCSGFGSRLSWRAWVWLGCVTVCTSSLPFSLVLWLTLWESRVPPLPSL